MEADAEVLVSINEARSDGAREARQQLLPPLMVPPTADVLS